MNSRSIVAVMVCGTALSSFAQGIVNFNNSNLPEPPDRTVYSFDGTPLVGTNFVAQLYWSTDRGASFTALTNPPARFRPSGIAPAGSWIGGNRTFPAGVGGVDRTVTLQLRIWNIATDATFEQAQASGGLWSFSSPFEYTQVSSQPVPQASDTWMINFRAFGPLSPPPGPAVDVRRNGEHVEVLFTGTHNIEASSNLREWAALGQHTAPFIDPDSVGMNARFYRLNDFGLYSRNAAGFYRLTFCEGFSLFANQLAYQANRISEILAVAPNNSQIYKFNPAVGVFDQLTYIEGFGWDDGGSGAMGMAVELGEGAFLYSPVRFTHTFIGHVASIRPVPIAPGFSIISSPLPIADSFQPPDGPWFPGQNGDTVYQWSCDSGMYRVSQYDEGSGWDGDLGEIAPMPAMGEAFFFFSPSLQQRFWLRSFCLTCP